MKKLSSQFFGCILKIQQLGKEKLHIAGFKKKASIVDTVMENIFQCLEKHCLNLQLFSRKNRVSSPPDTIIKQFCEKWIENCESRIASRFKLNPNSLFHGFSLRNNNSSDIINSSKNPIGNLHNPNINITLWYCAVRLDHENYTIKALENRSSIRMKKKIYCLQQRDRQLISLNYGEMDMLDVLEL